MKLENKPRSSLCDDYKTNPFSRHKFGLSCAEISFEHRFLTQILEHHLFGYNPLMSAFQKRLGSFLVGLYVWVLTISFGMTLLDILYARLVPEATPAFSKVSDFLLLVSLGTFLSAIAAIAFSMPSRTARNYLLTSQLISLLAFLLPAFFSLLGLNTPSLSIGPWLRIISGGAASLLAFIGLNRYNRQV